MVLFLGKMGGDENEGLEAEHTDRVLFVLRKLSVDREQLSDHVMLLKLGGEFSELGCAGPSNHGGILLAQLHKLFAETFLLGAGAGVSVVEKRAGGDSAGEPLALG